MKGYLYEAKQIINRYCFYAFEINGEYDKNVEYADFSDLTKVPLAYTTSEDERIEYQAVVDLINHEFRYYCDKELIDTERYNSIKELADIMTGPADFVYDGLIECCRKDD